MWVRTQLRIGWRDLIVGGLACVFPGNREKLRRKVEGYFSDDGKTVAAYSVRSGFDLLIQALDLKPGDEIIFSALNVKGMITVARKAGLVPVPLDLDIAHMAPSVARLEEAITPRSKVLVVAHLFGTKIDLDPLFELARRHGLFIAEDCAQAFNGRAYSGHGTADAAMFSFGPIKTATALGGALIRVDDPDLRHTIRRIQSGYPVQRNAKQLKRVVMFAGLKIATSPLGLQLLSRFYQARGRNYEDEFADRARDIAPLGKIKQRRYQPSAGMLALMARRLYRFKEGSLEERAAYGRHLRDLIGDTVVMPAQANDHHDYWVFPILVDDISVFTKRMRAEGFDVSNLPRSQTVAAPEGAEHLEPRIAAQVLSDLLVVPCYPSMPESEIKRQAKVIRAIAADVGSSRTRGYANL